MRMLYHSCQGPLGVLSVFLFDLVLSISYVRSGSLFPVAFTHILADIVPFAGA